MNHQINDSPKLWDCDLPPNNKRGLYIAISGNTAAGKSSLICRLEEELQQLGHNAVGVSERFFHHEYLRLMFSQPQDFAFPIQLSFMLNRHMVLLRNLVELGRVVIMERSHLDDQLFLDEHVATGAIDANQAGVYADISSTLFSRIPKPDILVLMNPEPELSISRLTRAEEQGDRPTEFPTDQAKIDWVNRWYNLYGELHDRFRRDTSPGRPLENTMLIEADAGAAIENNLPLVLNAVKSRLGM